MGGEIILEQNKQIGLQWISKCNVCNGYDVTILEEKNLIYQKYIFKISIWTYWMYVVEGKIFILLISYFDDNDETCRKFIVKFGTFL